MKTIVLRYVKSFLDHDVSITYINIAVRENRLYQLTLCKDGDHNAISKNENNWINGTLRVSDVEKAFNKVEKNLEIRQC